VNNMTATPVEAGALALKNELTDTAGTVLPYAAVLAGIVIGWRWVRKFVK
jgi:hypothetical protein